MRRLDVRRERGDRGEGEVELAALQRRGGERGRGQRRGDHRVVRSRRVSLPERRDELGAAALLPEPPRDLHALVLARRPHNPPREHTPLRNVRVDEEDLGGRKGVEKRERPRRSRVTKREQPHEPERRVCHGHSRYSAPPLARGGDDEAVMGGAWGVGGVGRG